VDNKDQQDQGLSATLEALTLLLTVLTLITFLSNRSKKPPKNRAKFGRFARAAAEGETPFSILAQAARPPIPLIRERPMGAGVDKERALPAQELVRLPGRCPGGSQRNRSWPTRNAGGAPRL
jgi:hypothetical protein